MKLSGWYRIGIVLSVLWCLFIVGITIYQYNNPPKESGLFIESTKPTVDAPPPAPAPCAMGYNCEEGDPYYEKPPEREVFYEYKPIIHYKRILISMILPIVGVWFLILSIKWVIRGFKESKET